MNTAESSRLTDPGLPREASGEGSASQSSKQRGAVGSLGLEDPLEEGVATHPSVLAWRTPWTEEPGGLQPTGSQSLTRLKGLSTDREQTGGDRWRGGAYRGVRGGQTTT